MKAPFLIGRMLFGGFFLYNGIHHLMQRKAMASYTASKGVPAAAAAVTLSAIPLIVGGTSLMLGVKPKIGAVALLGFLAVFRPSCTTSGGTKTRTNATTIWLHS
jgi:putative oxidoreductase